VLVKLEEATRTGELNEKFRIVLPTEIRAGSGYADFLCGIAKAGSVGSSEPRRTLLRRSKLRKKSQET